MDEAVLPYAGTSGWSGSETSKKRAVDNDKNGKTKEIQTSTLWELFFMADRGVTWKELAETYGWHHGTASGVLSTLHKAGKIVRLQQTRNRCAIYVLDTWIQGRPVAIRKVKTCKHCGGKL